jgi:protoporphyrinogen oxidase
MTRTLRVAVLGGGACGMTAAFALQRAGAQVTVIERERRAGGLCGTQNHGRFRFDLGGHRFISRNRALLELVQQLLGEELLLRRRSSVVLHRGKRFRYPLELDNVMRTIGLDAGAKMLGSYGLERLCRWVTPEADTCFEDWVVHRFGRALYDAFFGPYTEKLWGIPPNQISADWAAQRISLLSLSDVVLRLLHLRRGGVRTYARRYHYPKLGIGQIFERMAEVTASLGGDLVLGARVVGLATSRGRVTAVHYADDRGEHELPCDAVISTLSLPLLGRMLDAPDAIARAAGRLRFRAIRLCNILLDQTEVSPHTWMYVSEPRYLMSRIQEPRHRSPFAAPPGKTSLMLEIPCSVGDELWTAPEGSIYERCVDDLAALGFRGLRAKTIDHFASFVEEGYPIYHLDHRRDRDRVLDFVRETENVVSCGRQGTFRYIFMDTAMEMGLAAAQAVLAGGASGAVMRRIAGLRDEAGLVEAAALTV